MAALSSPWLRQEVGGVGGGCWGDVVCWFCDFSCLHLKASASFRRETNLLQAPFVYGRDTTTHESR